MDKTLLKKAVDLMIAINVVNKDYYKDIPSQILKLRAMSEKELTLRVHNLKVILDYFIKTPTLLESSQLGLDCVELLKKRKEDGTWVQ
jgi:hypothetical protein